MDDESENSIHAGNTPRCLIKLMWVYSLIVTVVPVFVFPNVALHLESTEEVLKSYWGLKSKQYRTKENTTPAAPQQRKELRSGE